MSYAFPRQSARLPKPPTSSLFAALILALIATPLAAAPSATTPAAAPADAKATPAPTAAQKKSSPVTIELNALTQVDKTCRLSLRIDNDLKSSIDDMALELVLFDWDGMTDRFVIVRTGKVPAHRSRVRQFDMPNLDCTNLGSVLLNDISECTGDGLTPDVCLDHVGVASRAPATFEY